MGVIKLIFRVVGAIFGVILMIIGGILTLTIIGAIIGIPMIIIGYNLMRVSIF